MQSAEVSGNAGTYYAPNPSESENRSWNDENGKMPLFSTGCESFTGDNLYNPVAGAARTE
jgi:hypothetical protein